jgi:hypothetical protein
LPIVAFALAALGLANHHVTAAPALPALVLLGLLTSPRVFLQRRFIVAAAIGLVALVALYASLIPLADRSAGLNWGGLDGPGPLFKHVVGSQYQSFLEEEGESVGRVASQIARGLLLDCSPIVALLAIAAIALARSRSSRASSIAWAPLLLLLATNVALSLIYIAGPEDRLAYDLPAHMSLCLLGAVGWRLLARRWARAVASPVAAALLVVALAFNVARNGRHCNLRQERVAQTLVREVLEPIPPGGLVITAEWNLMAPFLYMNRVEGYRTDARVIDVLLLRRTWYLHFLRREYPDLAAAGGAAFETFIEEATRFNRGEPYDVERINRAYADTMALWVRWGMERGGAYVDLPTIRQPQERQWLDRFDAQPEELLFRLSEIGVEPPAREMTPKDARNLAYVFAKAQRDGVIGDPLLIEPRNVQYWKVFGLYQSAVRASLVQIGANRGEEAARRVAERYRAWHPTIDADLDSAIETARRAAPLLPPPQSPPPPSQSTPPPSPAAPIVTRPVRKSR